MLKVDEPGGRVGSRGLGKNIPVMGDIVAGMLNCWCRIRDPAGVIICGVVLVVESTACCGVGVCMRGSGGPIRTMGTGPRGVVPLGVMLQM